VAPTTAVLTIGEDRPLVATGNDADVTGAASWSTSDAGVASVAGGTVTGVAPGVAVITATWQGLTATCSIEVVDDE